MTYDLIKFFLQEQKLPASIQTADLVMKMSDIKQRSSQSVPNLVACLNNLETQFDPLLINLQWTHHLFVALHLHIRQIIVEQKQQWDTHKMFKKVATVIKAGKPLLAEICPQKVVKTPATLALEYLSKLLRCTKRSKLAARLLVSYAKKCGSKCCPAPTSNLAKPPRVASGTVLGKSTNSTNITVTKTAPAPTPSQDHSTWKCYNCHEIGHILKDCTWPRTSLGKVESQ